MLCLPTMAYTIIAYELAYLASIPLSLERGKYACYVRSSKQWQCNYDTVLIGLEMDLSNSTIPFF